MYFFTYEIVAERFVQVLFDLQCIFMYMYDTCTYRPKCGWKMSMISICFCLSFSVHLCVTYIHTQDGIDERFLNDVQDAVTEIQKDPNAEIGGMVRNIDI